MAVNSVNRKQKNRFQNHLKLGVPGKVLVQCMVHTFSVSQNM